MDLMKNHFGQLNMKAFDALMSEEFLLEQIAQSFCSCRFHAEERICRGYIEWLQTVSPTQPSALDISRVLVTTCVVLVTIQFGKCGVWLLFMFTFYLKTTGKSQFYKNRKCLIW